MPPWKLMRRVSEQPDTISRCISETIMKTGQDHRAYDRWHAAPGEGAQFFLKFWNMKQTGELHESELPSVWAVMMRAVDASAVVRMVLEACAQSVRGMHIVPGPMKRLGECIANYRRTAHGRLSPQFVAKLRTNLCARLRTAQAMGNAKLFDTLDASDAELLLRACEVALEVKREADKQ